MISDMGFYSHSKVDKYMLKICNENYEINKTVTFPISRNVDKFLGGESLHGPTYIAKQVSGGNEY